MWISIVVTAVLCWSVCLSSIDVIDEGNIITGCSLLLKNDLFMYGRTVFVFDTGYQNECQLNQAVLRAQVIALVRAFEITSLAGCYQEVIWFSQVIRLQWCCPENTVLHLWHNMKEKKLQGKNDKLDKQIKTQKRRDLSVSSLWS